MFDVTLDDGTALPPLALNVGQLQGAGVQPFAAHEGATAVAGEPVSLPSQESVYQEQPTAPPTPGLAARGATAGPVAPEFAPQAQAPAAPEFTPGWQPPGGAVAPPGPKGPLVPARAPSGAAKGAPDDAVAFAELIRQEELAPRGGPARVIPERDERAAFTIQRGAEPLPEDRAAVEDASLARADAELDVAAAEGARYGATSELRAEEVQREAEAIEEETTRRANIDADINTRMRDLDGRLTEVKELHATGSPRERVWNRKEGFSRFLAGLGLILSKWASAASGGSVPDIAGDILNEEVEDELKREEQMVSDTGEARGQLAELIRVHGAPEPARIELGLRKKEQALARAEQLALQSGVPERMAAFRQWAAQYREQLARERETLNAQIAGSVTEQWRHVPRQVVGGQRQPSNLEAIKKAAEGAKAWREIKGAGASDENTERVLSRSVTLPDGTKAYAPDKDRAIAAEKVIGTTSQIRRNMARVQELLANDGALVSTSPKARAELGAVLAHTKVLAKDGLELGAITEADAALINPIVGAGADAIVRKASIYRTQLAESDRQFAARENAATRTLSRDPSLSQPVRQSVPSFKERR
jgi:hypothetical protein